MLWWVEISKIVKLFQTSEAAAAGSQNKQEAVLLLVLGLDQSQSKQTQ